MATKAFARYTTFKEGELERTLHTLDPQGRYRHLTGTGTGRSRSGIITSHNCSVTYPDATTGTCRYLRGGPNWHIFRFEHKSQRCGKTAQLPVQNQTERIGNTLAVIEENAQKLAEAAFYEAVEREKTDYFRRVLPPPSYKMAQAGGALAEPPQMKAKEAKLAAGRYALCIRVGRSLLPTGESWDKMSDAVDAWKSGTDLSRVIGCCCRWKRRWEEPFYNPLHGDSRYPRLPLPFPCADQKSVQETAKLGGQATQAVIPVKTESCIATVPQWAVVGEAIPAHSEEDAPPDEDCDDYDEFDESPDLWEGDDDE